MRHAPRVRIFPSGGTAGSIQEAGNPTLPVGVDPKPTSSKVCFPARHFDAPVQRGLLFDNRSLNQFTINRSIALESGPAQAILVLLAGDDPLSLTVGK
jgi:hypothetical protein